MKIITAHASKIYVETGFHTLDILFDSRFVYDPNFEYQVIKSGNKYSYIGSPKPLGIHTVAEVMSIDPFCVSIDRNGADYRIPREKILGIENYSPDDICYLVSEVMTGITKLYTLGKMVQAEINPVPAHELIACQSYVSKLNDRISNLILKRGYSEDFESDIKAELVSGYDNNVKIKFLGATIFDSDQGVSFLDTGTAEVDNRIKGIIDLLGGIYNGSGRD